MSNRKIALILFFMFSMVCPIFIHSSIIYTDQNTHILNPDTAVVLDDGIVGISEISINGTRANVTVAAGITYDFVDSNGSNIDSSSDKGVHGNFTAQQYGPDSIIDTLVEENTGGSGNASLFLYVAIYDGARTDWTQVGTTPYLNTIDYNSNYVHARKNNYETGDFSFENSSKSSETIQNVTIQLYARQTATNNPIRLFVWDGSTWANLGIQDPNSSFGWINYTATTLLNTWTKIDGAKIYMRTTTGNGLYEVDCARLVIDYTESSNYEADLEVQWNNIDFNETNEYLCIYGGTMSPENIQVDVWNGTEWENILIDLNPGWNNVSVTSYLTSSNFTIRYKAVNETGDGTQDSWNIDAALLNVWTETYDYILNATSQKAYDQNITLRLFNYSDIDRLANCTIWFHDGTQSVQINIIDGVLIQDSGPLYFLPADSSRNIAVFVEQSSPGTSNLDIKLEAVAQNLIVYSCLIELLVK